MATDKRAVLEEPLANDTLPEVITAAMKKLRETNPKAAHAALRAIGVACDE